MKLMKSLSIVLVVLLSTQAKAAVVVAGAVATVALSMPVASTGMTTGALNSEDVQLVKSDALLAQAGYEITPALSSVLADSRYLIEAEQSEFFSGMSEVEIRAYLINIIANL